MLRRSASRIECILVNHLPHRSPAPRVLRRSRNLFMRIAPFFFLSAASGLSSPYVLVGSFSRPCASFVSRSMMAFNIDPTTKTDHPLQTSLPADGICWKSPAAGALAPLTLRPRLHVHALCERNQGRFFCDGTLTLPCVCACVQICICSWHGSCDPRQQIFFQKAAS